MRGLVGLVIFMGVLIVAGVATLGVVLVHRLGAAAPLLAAAGPVLLDEPAATHIMGATEAGGRVTLALQGGGPDRVVVLDLASGRVIGRIALAH